MTKNNSNTARLDSLETVVGGMRDEVRTLATTIEALATRIGAVAASPVLTAPEAAPVAAPAAPVAEAKGPSFRELRDALKAHKAAGAIKAGVTVKEAIAAGLMTDQGTLPGTVASTTTTAPAKAPKVVAEVAAAAPAKERAADGPRDAMGRITPKAEWAQREALALTGSYDRHEIDKIMASLAVMDA